MSQNLLDRIRIGTPCQADWEAMRGDDRVRFCGQCEKHVYNLSQMTRQQAEALILKTNGNLCARFERRADGGIVTTEEAVPLPRFNFRFLRIASATMSAALSLAPTVAAKTAKNLPVLQQQEKKEKSADQSQVKEKTAKIFGTVFDEQKAVIANVKITMTDESQGFSKATQSNSEGKYDFFVLSAGSYTLTFESAGFVRGVNKLAYLGNGDVMRFDTTLRVGWVGGLTLIEPELPYEPIPEGLLLNIREELPLPPQKAKKSLASILLSIFSRAKDKAPKQ